MRLINLSILINSEQVRNIAFKKGLNLITNRKDIGHSGNSVGKSTLSRVVDFLFLASIDPIYIDEEFGQPNKDIENLFEDNHVFAQLNYVGVDGIKHSIGRVLAVSKEDEYWADGVKVEKSLYESSIQKSCFSVNTKRPSVRALIPKFIRNNTHRMLHTTKFLDSREGDKTYSELYLYLLGFQNTEVLTEKRNATNLLNRRKRNLKVLNAMIKEQKPKTELKPFASKVKILEEELLKFDFAPQHSNPIDQLTKIQDEDEQLTEILLSINRNISNIESTLRKFSEENSENYLKNELTAIYQYAGVAIDGALRDLEDVFSFHKNLIDKKKEFIGAGLPELRAQKQLIEQHIETVREEKNKIFEGMKSKDTIDAITKKIKELGELKVELGKLEGLLEQQSKADSEKKKAEKELSKTIIEISTQLKNVDSFLVIFNQYLSTYTNKLHEDDYSLKFDFDKKSGNCAIDLTNRVTNPEGGKKKAEVIAFDFAYIQAVAEQNLARPLFVFHDFVEDIDQRQFDDILKLANKLHGQQILSVLVDNFSDNTFNQYKDCFILELDETDRFFKA